jgi:hypothetical protein
MPHISQLTRLSIWNRDLRGRICAIVSVIKAYIIVYGRTQVTFHEIRSQGGTSLYHQRQIARLHKAELVAQLGFEVTVIEIEQPDGELVELWQWDDPGILQSQAIN